MNGCDNYYKIAGLTIATNAKNYLSDNFTLFEVEELPEGKADIHIVYDDDAHKMYRLMQDAVFEKVLLYTDFMSIYEAEDHYTLATYNDKKYVGVHILKNEKKGIVYTNDTAVPRGAMVNANELGLTEEDLYLNAFREIFMFYAQQCGRIAVHSSSIKYRNRAFLFSGCSGAGKSTHVDQWKSAGIPFEMIDGDIAVVYKKDGAYVAAGLPWCGTSEAYSNLCVPLGGIYFIRKCPDNYVKDLAYVDRVLNLNAEVLSPNWQRKLMEQTLDIAEDLCKVTDVSELYCRADAEAACVMRKHIDEIIEEAGQ